MSSTKDGAPVDDHRTPTAPARLHGRGAECTAIDTLLQQTRSGNGGCLVLHGEPGIGKTALVEYARTHADSMHVLYTAGAERESDVPYAALHRLLSPILCRTDRLPEPQGHALDAVFGQLNGSMPDRFLVGLAALSLLADVADERPALCLIDDVHWIDTASQDVFTFIARRADTKPVAMIMAMPPDEGRPLDTRGFKDVELTGIDRSAALRLLAERGGVRLPLPQRERIVNAAGGNAMALAEAPVAALRRATDGPVPLPPRLHDAFLKRTAHHDHGAQQALLLIAAEGRGTARTIRRALTMLAGDPDVLDNLEDLIEQDGTTIAFRHPLIRSAVYYEAGPAQRREIHRVLAHTSDAHGAEASQREERRRDAQLDRRAWHLGKVTDEPDEAVAELLDKSANRALPRSGPAAAATALDRAAQLSTSEPARVRRLLKASDAWWQAGDTSRATELMHQAERVDSLPDGAALDLAALRATSDLRSGSPDDAVTLLSPLIPPALHDNREQAVHLLMLFTEACIEANATQAYAGIESIIDDLHSQRHDVVSVLLRLVRANYRVRSGMDGQLSSADLTITTQLTDPRQLCWASELALGIGEPELARRLRDDGVRTARRLGSSGLLGWALESVVADDVGRGRFTSAETHTNEGHRLAVETGQSNLAFHYQSWIMLLRSLRGDELQVRDQAPHLLAQADEFGLWMVSSRVNRALGLLDLAAGRPHDALTRFQSRCGYLGAYTGIDRTNVPDIIDAAVHAYQTDLAKDLLHDFLPWANANGSPGMQALAARCIAQLASTDTATEKFRRALQLHASADQPLERARTELLLGEHLRRTRKRAAARVHLRAALETFQRLGTPVWAGRAQEELRATGETARGNNTSVTTILTPQELRIVEGVTCGATNRDVAAQLFLSPRTVDYHLRKVFRKLGITSRSELIQLSLNNHFGSQRSKPE